MKPIRQLQLIGSWGPPPIWVYTDQSSLDLIVNASVETSPILCKATDNLAMLHSGFIVVFLILVSKTALVMEARIPLAMLL